MSDWEDDTTFDSFQMNAGAASVPDYGKKKDSQSIQLNCGPSRGRGRGRRSEAEPRGSGRGIAPGGRKDYSPGRGRRDYSPSGEKKMGDYLPGRERRRRDYSPRGERRRDSSPRGERRRDYSPRGERRRDYSPRGERRRDYSSRGEKRRDYSPRGERRRDYSPRGERRRDYSPRGERRRDYSPRGERRRDYSPRGERRDYSPGGRGRPFASQKQFGSSWGGEESLTMQVYSSEVGRIIGRGGQRIRELEDASGARIKVHRSQGGELETTVEISGEPEAREKAREMIEEIVTPIKDITDKLSGIGLDGGNGVIHSQEWKQPAPVRINWASLNASREQVEAEKWAGLPPIKKNFYFEDPEVASMTVTEVEFFWEQRNNISVTSLSEEERTVPNPVKTFEQAFSHYPEILDEIAKAKFTDPTPIQCQSWSILLQGFDMVGIAQTGTGKTLAFLLPALIHIDGQETPRAERGGPTVLILSPTRELALQIQTESNKYSYKGIRSLCVYGGGNRREQIKNVEKGVEIVIATPGRLNDLLMNEILSVKSVTYLVLDEADRMLDMGFEPQIKKILLDIRPDRQTVMTSATWPLEVRRLARAYLKNPFQVSVGSLDLRACNLVEQTIEFLDDSRKKDRTIEFITNMKDGEKVLIFTGRKITADDISSDFTLRGINVQCIHGDREQCDREQALDDFKTGRVAVLIATDVASRGLDIKDITYVVNYDFPHHIEDYVHRVGRTGRAGQTGKALSFITRENWRWSKDLINILAEAHQVVPEELVAMAERYEAWKARKDSQRDDRRGRPGGMGRRGRSHNESSFI